MLDTSLIDVWRDVPTPFLTVDEATLLSNIGRAQEWSTSQGMSLRPHAKTHKLGEIALAQLRAGADGLTVASLGEAKAFAEAGVSDLFLAYSVYATPTTARQLAALCERGRLRLAVDSREAVDSLRGHGLHRRSNLSLIVEVDSGMRRSGVTPRLSAEIARHAADAGFRVVGAFTYPGHSYGKDLGRAAARLESEALSQAAVEMKQCGLTCTVLSGGSTPSFYHSDASVLTEARPGVYALNDAQQLVLGTARLADVAVAVVATVVSVPERGRFVIDAGSKALASDRPSFIPGHGFIPEMDRWVSRLWEHHGVVDTALDDESRPPRVGDRLLVIPNHVCTAINLADRVHVRTTGGTEVWQLIARGLNA